MAFFKNLPRAFGDVVREYGPLQAISAWKKVAGPVITKHVEFLGFHKVGEVVVLQLSVRDPVWRQEIQFEKKRILQSLEKELKTYNWETDRIPTDISFQSHPRLNSGNPQFRRDKKLIKP